MQERFVTTTAAARALSFGKHRTRYMMKRPTRLIGRHWGRDQNLEGYSMERLDKTTHQHTKVHLKKVAPTILRPAGLHYIDFATARKTERPN